MSAREEDIDRLLTRNVAEVIEKNHLREALLSGKKLRIKFGIDPTSPDLHLGHAVVLRKLREFQDQGHVAVLVVGDFTGRIGDPSERSEARKALSAEEVKANMRNYLSQAGLVLDMKKTEVVYNSAWFKKEGIDQFMQLAAAGTFQQALRRADFKKRIEADKDITLLELLYPLFQGYDSVKMRADVEIGGTDQTFNLLTGRHVQRHFGMPEQDVLTLPLLEGLDGVKKMSKSLGNYIGLTDAPGDMFGKTMSLPDALVHKYFILCTDLPEEEIKRMEKEFGPKELKERLGLLIVTRYHDEKAAEAARMNFERLFSKKEVSNDVPELKLKRKTISILDLVLASDAATSKSDARRLIEQGGVDMDNVVKKDAREVITLHGGEVIKLGKKRFFRIK